MAVTLRATVVHRIRLIGALHTLFFRFWICPPSGPAPWLGREQALQRGDLGLAGAQFKRDRKQTATSSPAACRIENRALPCLLTAAFNHVGASDRGTQCAWPANPSRWQAPAATTSPWQDEVCGIRSFAAGDKRGEYFAGGLRVGLLDAARAECVHTAPHGDTCENGANCSLLTRQSRWCRVHVVCSVAALQLRAKRSEWVRCCGQLAAVPAGNKPALSTRAAL